MVFCELMLKVCGFFNITVFPPVSSRHMLCAVVRHHHAEHQSAQPECERQAVCRQVHRDESRHQRWWGPARRAPCGL